MRLAIIALALAGIMGACSSAQDDAAEAQERVSNERLELVEHIRSASTMQAMTRRS